MRCKASGPTDAKIVFVGEAPGEKEDKWGVPFVGGSGEELRRMCAEAGLPYAKCFVTNVFMDRPPNNQLANFCVNKQRADDLASQLGWPSYPFEPLGNGLYVEPYRCLELLRLRDEINSVNPNLVVALGGTALWALIGVTGINKWRGAITPGVLTPHKVLPTIHPSAILRNWEQRLIVVMDLIKAQHESTFPEIKYDRREIWINPTIPDLWQYYHKYVLPASKIAEDIETYTYKSKRQHRPFISMICIAVSKSRALVCPFIKTDGTPYWSTVEEELEAWDFVAAVGSLSQPKIFQNGLFDTQYLLDYRIPIINYSCDPMYSHHALYPGMIKGLGFLGSIYANEGPWKQFRPKSKVEKPDD